MKIVTYDGRILCPGPNFDYVITEKGIPKLRLDRMLPGSVVQVLDTGDHSRRIYKVVNEKGDLDLVEPYIWMPYNL